MSWDAEKIRGLRLRMGWSQCDLARRLQAPSTEIETWESGTAVPPENLASALDLLFKQAEMSADEISQAPLAEILLEESELEQIDVQKIKHFLDN